MSSPLVGGPGKSGLFRFTIGKIEKMENHAHTFDILANLPRIRKRKIWEVYVDGKLVQLVGATDNRKATAERYIAGKYPNVQFTLKFLEYRI